MARPATVPPYVRGARTPLASRRTRAIGRSAAAARTCTTIALAERFRVCSSPRVACAAARSAGSRTETSPDGSSCRSAPEHRRSERIARVWLARTAPRLGGDHEQRRHGRLGDQDDASAQRHGGHHGPGNDRRGPGERRRLGLMVSGARSTAVGALRGPRARAGRRRGSPRVAAQRRRRRVLRSSPCRCS